jgi:hypothetical protein
MTAHDLSLLSSSPISKAAHEVWTILGERSWSSISGPPGACPAERKCPRSTGCKGPWAAPSSRSCLSRSIAVASKPSANSIPRSTFGQALRAVGAIGLPTTLVIDRAGQEVGRAIGPAEWDSPEIAATLRAVMTNTGGRLGQRQDPDRSNLQASPGPLRRAFDWLMAPVTELILDRETPDNSSEKNRSRLTKENEHAVND